VAPNSKLLMVQTSAGNVATPGTGELPSLWTSVQGSRAGALPR